MNSEGRRHLDRASSRLRVAKKLLKDRELEDAISRAYYAMYHAAKALLLAKGSNPKTHESVLREIGRLYVKTGELPVRAGRSLAKAKTLREKSDYAPIFRAERDVADQMIREAEEFIALTRVYLTKHVHEH
jgi:uncharacterized protein (UPF0332 family)